MKRPYTLRDPDEVFRDPFRQFNRLNDALLGSQPGSMNEIFKELRERGGFEIEGEEDE
jgi:hypothetical protein